MQEGTSQDLFKQQTDHCAEAYHINCIGAECRPAGKVDAETGNDAACHAEINILTHADADCEEG